VSGRPGRLPARAPHRSGRAELPHPALPWVPRFALLHCMGATHGCHVHTSTLVHGCHVHSSTIMGATFTITQLICRLGLGQLTTV
jgi:hypothetical protein